MGKTKKHKKFFEQDTPHGIVKRVMYKKYLQAYIAKTQNEQFNLKTIIIDGFAGAGRYSQDWPEEIEKYGSPLIALKVTLDFLLKKAERLANKTSVDTETNDEKNEEDTEESRISKSSVIEPTEESSISKASVTAPQTDEQENKSQHHDNVCSWISAVNLSDDDLEEIAKSKRQEGFDENTDINMIFIDVDKTNYRSLVNNIELMLVKFLMSHLPTYRYKYSENSEEDKHSTTFSMNIPPYSFAITLNNRKFETFDPPLELEAKCTRSLTFLDPFGFSHTPMEHVKKFAPGEGNEIFINFMSRDVNRNIKNRPKYICGLYGIDVPDESDLAGFVEYIIFSFDSQNEGASYKGNISKCTEVYEHYLTKKTQTAYSQAFEVRNQGNVITYHLIHITNHIRGIEAMKESMNRCSQKHGEMAMSDFDIVRKGHKLNFGNLDDPDVVAGLVFEKFKGKQNVLLEPSARVSNEKLKLSRNFGRKVYNCLPTVKEFVLLDTKFLYRKNAIATLQRQGKITKVVDENNEPQKRQYCFPDKNSKTKIPKKWYVSFANEAPESNYSFKNRHELKEKEQEDKKKQKDANEKIEKEKAKQERKERQQREKEKKSEKLEMKRQMEKKRREEELSRQKQQASKVERQKMSKQNGNYYSIFTKVTKPIAETITTMAVGTEMEPVIEKETSATRLDETEPMAPAETDASRIAETEPMAAAETSATRLDEPEPMAAAETSATRLDETEPMAAAETSASQVDETELMAAAETSATRLDETEPIAAAETSATRLDETEPMAAAETSATRLDETEPMAATWTSATRLDETDPMDAAETSATRLGETEPLTAAEASGVTRALTLKRKKITDYFPSQKKKGTVLTMYNTRDESSQERQKKESNSRQKENKEERTRKKKRCETRRLSEVHDENEYVMTETERCTSGIGDNAPNDHGL